MDTKLPRHIEHELRLLGVLPTKETVDQKPSVIYDTPWKPTHKDEQPPF